MGTTSLNRKYETDGSSQKRSATTNCFGGKIALNNERKALLKNKKPQKKYQ
jgi:hypothetical protein